MAVRVAQVLAAGSNSSFCAFATVVHCEHDILLIDEALSVGDRAFQEKCLKSFQRLRKVDMREQVIDVPPQDVITKDNVLVTVDAVIYFQIILKMSCLPAST